RKVSLLEEKQILSVGVFDEVFITWMTFEGNTQCGDDVTGITKRHRDLSSDGIRDLTTASERSRLKRNPRRLKIKMIIRRAREVPDIVLIITPSYELGFQRFKSPRVQNEKIYNFAKNDVATASLVSPDVVVMNRLKGVVKLLIEVLRLPHQVFGAVAGEDSRYTQIDINYATGRNLRRLSAEEAWETNEDCAQYDKQ
ncbi:hypothetical protein Tco_1322489, partial [Tanacetum coccineum]